MAEPQPNPEAYPGPDVHRAADAAALAALDEGPVLIRPGRIRRRLVAAAVEVAYRAGREAAAQAAETALKAESGRLAAPADDITLPLLRRRDAVEQGIGVALAADAVVRAARGENSAEPLRPATGTAPGCVSSG